MIWSMCQSCEIRKTHTCHRYVGMTEKDKKYTPSKLKSCFSLALTFAWPPHVKTSDLLRNQIVLFKIDIVYIQNGYL